MYISILDFETSIHTKKEGTFTPSPYYPQNKIVYGGVLQIPVSLLPLLLLKCSHSKMFSAEEFFQSFRANKEINYYLLDFIKNQKEHAKKLQDILNDTEILVAHHAKFDCAWLEAANFKYNKIITCTMNNQHILHRGVRYGLSLDEVASRHGIIFLKSPYITDLFKKGFGADKIYKSDITPYLLSDVLTTAAVWLKQLLVIKEKSNIGLVPTLHLINEYIYPLVEMEKNGVHVNIKEVQNLQEETNKEILSIDLKLAEIVRDLNGSTVVNFNSGDQLSQFIYSRKVTDKDYWKIAFNIGPQSFPPRMTTKQFVNTTKAYSKVCYKTKSEVCKSCTGTGKKPPNNVFKCKYCTGTGVTHIDTKDIAGLKLVPKGASYTTAYGFKTDQDTLTELLKTAKGVAKDFLEVYLQRSKLCTTAQTMLPGILNNIVPETSLLHPNYNQCVAATSRLTSSKPNWQNITNGHPVRKAITSRWPGGMFTQADEAQLEYRTAVFLAQDKVGMKDISNKVDAHKVTADIVFPMDEYSDRKWSRYHAKAHTFKPLYGGTSGTPREVQYYKYFLEKHEDINQWHKFLQEQAIKYHKIILPSGREYSFPHAKRRYDGSSTDATKIKNYPVQGFATADMMPVAIIALYRKMKEVKDLQSKLVMTTHDDVIADTHPKELKLMPEIMVETLGNLHHLLKVRYDIDFNVPLKIEIKQGLNLLDLNSVLEYESGV